MKQNTKRKQLSRVRSAEWNSSLNLSCHENENNVFTDDWAVHWYHDCGVKRQRVVTMTHQTLSLGKGWKLCWATLSANLYLSIILTCAVYASCHKARADSSISIFVLHYSGSAVACTKWFGICSTNLVPLICRARSCIGLEAVIAMSILRFCQKMKQFGKVSLNSPFTIIIYFFVDISLFRRFIKHSR